MSRGRKQAYIAVYEDYDSPKEKSKAQRTAKPKMRVPTGLARGYIFVFAETANVIGLHDCVSSLLPMEPGEKAPKSLVSSQVSKDYLRGQCRRIGAIHLPPDWRTLYDYYYRTK